VTGVQNANGARLNFLTENVPDLVFKETNGGIEVRAHGKAAYQFANLPKLREVTGIELRMEGDASIAIVHLAANCAIHQKRLPHSVRLDLIDKSPASAASAATPVVPSVPSVPTAASAAAAKASPDLSSMRELLIRKITMLDAKQAPTTPKGKVAKVLPQSVSPAGIAAPPAVAQSRPACPPEFSMEGWKGDGPFPQRLQSLRALAAQSEESASAMAALAEFYLSNGLGAEALVIAQEVKPDGVSAEDQRRLSRDADLARLLKAQPIESTSVLLSNSADCDRADIPLWRALSAAAAGDQEAIRRDSEAAGYALQFIPEPLSTLFSLRIAEVAPDDLSVLHAMAGAVRNSDIGGPVDASGRYMLQARIARARKDPVDEASFLERAARDIGITGLKAQVRLAELRSAQEDDQGRQAESILADAARVYRDTTFGQSAASALSEDRLRHGDYVGALRVANDSSVGSTLQQTDSHGATLAARVLRRIFVDKDAPGLPAPEQRLLIYWRYSGYATPGEKGDDIRLGAARLMLDQMMPEAALDVMRQVTDQSARAALLHATAEARAGDAEVALSLLKNIATDDGTRHVAAEALVRLGKTVEAAHQLDGITDLSVELWRASLLYEAKEWPGAADAYADVLRNASLEKDVHAEAADRYALALALCGKQPAQDLAGFSGLAGHVLGALPEQASTPLPPVPAIRDSLRRASQIEALLPPAGRLPTANGG